MVLRAMATRKCMVFAGAVCDEQFHTKQMFSWLMVVGGHFGMSVGRVSTLSLLVAPAFDPSLARINKQSN